MAEKVVKDLYHNSDLRSIVRSSAETWHASGRVNLSALEAMVNAELRRVEQSVADSRSATADSYYARADASSNGNSSRGGRSRGRGGSPRFPKRCWKCDQPGHVRRDCTAGSKADAGTFMVSAVVNTNMAEEYHRPLRQQTGSIPTGWK